MSAKVRTFAWALTFAVCVGATWAAAPEAVSPISPAQEAESPAEVLLALPVDPVEPAEAVVPVAPPGPDVTPAIEPLPEAEPAAICRMRPLCDVDADCDAVCGGEGLGDCVRNKCPIRICRCG